MGLFSRTPPERFGADLVDRLPLGITIYRLERPGDPTAFRITYLNPASGAITGLDVEAEVGRMVLDVAPNVAETGILDAYLDVLAAGEPRDLGTIEYGDDRIAHATYAIHAIPLGATRLAIAFEDVSARAEAQALRLTQAELRREEARYRSLVEASAAIVWTTPPSGELGADQAQWRAFTGQSVEESVGWGWLEAVHPDDQAATAEAWRAAVAAVATYEMTHRLRRPDGTYRRMRVRAAPVRDESGALVEWVGVHTDVEAEQRALAALEASESRFRTLFDAIGDVLLVYPIGPGGAEPFIAFNEEAIARYGYSADELRAMTVEDLVVDAGAAVESALDELRRTRAGTFESVHLAKSGDRLYMSTHARLVEYDGRLCVVALCRDDTDGRRFRREIARSNRRLEEAVAERTRQLEAFSEDLKILHEITTAEHASPHARFEAYLRAGCEMFGLGNGILSRVTGWDGPGSAAEYHVEAVVTAGGMSRGDRVALADTFCDHVVERRETVVYADAMAEYPDNPACADRGLRAFLGTPVEVGGEVFGTLNFSSPVPREGGFTAAERDLVEVMAQAVGRSIEADRAERARAATEALYRSVLDAANEGIYGLDLEGRTTFVNETAVRITGYPAADQIGARQHDLIHHHRADGSDYPVEACPIYRTLRDGETRSASDDVFWRPDGTAVPVSYTVSPIREGDALAGAVVVFRERGDR